MIQQDGRLRSATVDHEIVARGLPAEVQFRAMQLRLQYQQNPVADEVSALLAVVLPILEGVLYALKREVVDTQGGFERVPLFMLPRLYP